jgi:hypothetical protein
MGSEVRAINSGDILNRRVREIRGLLRVRPLLAHGRQSPGPFWNNRNIAATEFCGETPARKGMPLLHELGFERPQFPAPLLSKAVRRSQHGSVPVGWQVRPTATDIMPDILDYYDKPGRAGDYFVSPERCGLHSRRRFCGQLTSTGEAADPQGIPEAIGHLSRSPGHDADVDPGRNAAPKC